MHVALVCPSSMSNPHEKQAFWFVNRFTGFGTLGTPVCVYWTISAPPTYGMIRCCIHRIRLRVHCIHCCIPVHSLRCNRAPVHGYPNNCHTLPHAGVGCTVGTADIVVAVRMARLLHICLILRYRRCDWCDCSWKRLRDRQWCRGCKSPLPTRMLVHCEHCYLLHHGLLLLLELSTMCCHLLQR